MTLNVRARYDAEAGSFVAGTRQARDELERLRRASSATSGGLRGTGTSARGAGDRIEGYSRDTARARRETRGFGSDLSRLRGLIAGVGIGLLTREVLRTGFAAESMSARFRAATGSVEAGEAAMRSARDTAERFGLDLVAVERGLSGLLAASRGTEIEDQAATIFEGVATAAAALQLPAEQVQRALTAIEQVMSKGKVSAEELRGQLGEAIPGAFQIAARAMDVTTSELDKMLESGELLAEDLLPRLGRQLIEEYGESARAAAEAATADFAGFRNEITLTQREFAQSGFLEGVTDGMTAITQVLRDPGTQEGLRAFGRVLGDGLAFAAENAGDLGQAIGTLIAMRFASNLIGWGRAARDAGRGLTILGAGVRALGGPVGIALGVLSAALAALPFVIEDNDERIAAMRDATDRAGEAMRRYAEASRQAARDQDELGGKVRAATQDILNQSRAELQTELERLDSQFQLTLDDLLGNGLLDLSDIAALRREIVGEVAQMYREIGDEAGRFRLHQEGAVNTDLLGDVFGPIVEMLNQLESGDTTVLPVLSQELARIAGAGDEARRAAEQAVLAFEGIENIDLADAQAQIIRVAEGIGGLDDLIANVLGADSEQARVRAIGVLADRMFTLARAGELLREDGPAAFREMLQLIGPNREQAARLEAALDGTLKLTEDTADAAGDIDYSGAANSASAMAGELERAGRALATLQGGLIDLDLQNVGLEAEIAALEAGASRAEARIEGELARARAQLEPLLSQRRPPIDGGGAPQATVAAEAALRDQERELERKLANEARIADLVKRFSSDGGGGGGVAGEVDLAGSVVEEFGQRFGGTFDFATAKIEDWRAATLASLQAAGLGHTELADMVDEIARDRLAEAYQQDLANREDWAAGIERGLDDIFGTQLTMAEVAEDTIKAAFRSMEDAFVSLATTGKIETADLVDFALRQLFRLAAAAATGNLDSAGGGIFGSILSSLFGGGIGVSTQAGAAAAGLPSVFDSSGAIALPQFHEGGMVRDGRATRRVPAHLFDGARKRHSGGLAGNEVPAILEDDERVLTLAQQQSTAATIAGLAQLAAAPRPAAQPAPPPANVNVRVFGADREPRVEARQNGNDLDIDLIFREVEGRLGRNLAQGRGLAPAIAGRFNLRGGV
jgi:lambda family phage tail tape measure protein